MPHFIIECSEAVLDAIPSGQLMDEVFDTAHASGLFAIEDIKVRIRSYQTYRVGTTNSDFLHIFGNIMEGRTTAQKADLSRRIVVRLKELLPDVPILSINIREFERATYCNRTMV